MTDQDDMDGSMPFRPMGSPPDDAWLEQLLARDAAAQPHLDDRGFTARVMIRTRVPRSQVSRWLVPAMTVAGCAATAFLTPAGDYLAHGLTSLLDYHHLTPSSLLLLVPIAVLYACSIEAARES